MISNSGHDERGKYRGGKAGDQTGGEWAIIKWYNRPWKCILRHPDKKAREEIAKLARSAAKNNKIGYDQNQRTTFWEQLKKSNYDPAKITTACEADCSAGVAAIVKAVGYRLDMDKLKNVSKDAYTGNLRAVLKAAGFTCLTASKYLTSDKYLLPGDVLLYDGHHTAINLDAGIKTGSDNTDAGSTILKKGSKGTAVKTMQKMLIACGYSCGSCGADGDFGTSTEKALRKFQKESKLTIDGQYGPKSKAKLEAAYKKVLEKPKEEPKGVYPCKKYALTESQKKKLAAMVYQEGGYNQECMDAVASHMCNLYEYKTYIHATKKSFYAYISTTKWYAAATRKNTRYTSAAMEAVERCIIGGRRTLPPYVDEFDMYPGDIKSPKKISAYKRESSKITNIYGASGTYWGATVVNSAKNKYGKKGNLFFFTSEKYKKHCGY